jgi:hypothetical protein
MKSYAELDVKESMDQTDRWLASGSRKFWIGIAVILLISMLYFGKISHIWGGTYHPLRSCLSGIACFVLMFLMSLADDGGLGDGEGL